VLLLMPRRRLVVRTLLLVDLQIMDGLLLLLSPHRRHLHGDRQVIHLDQLIPVR
jgi:hypothetical protein